MKIQVTREDIENGKRCSATQCPAALALMRALKLDRIIVRLDSIATPSGGRMWRFDTPPVLRDFIHAFDDGDGTAKPIEFELDIS